MRVAFIAFGCKVNQAEMDKLIPGLAGLNAEYVRNAGDANIAVVNTCAVTEKAQKDGEKYLKHLKERNPGLSVIATGCLAELLKDSLKDSGVDVVVSNADKDSILNIIREAVNGNVRSWQNKAESPLGLNEGGAEDAHTRTIFSSRIPDQAHNGGKEQAADGNDSSAMKQGKTFFRATRTRGFVKIQDGCDSFCAYCIIPSLRGAPASVDTGAVCDEITALVGAGYKEIVLTGIHIGMYGKDKGAGCTLLSLLKKLLEIKGDFRIRLSSLEVPEVTSELLSLVANSGGRICQYFHISLQSGSAAILSKMGRKYVPGDFLSAVEAIRKTLPDACIGADVITGFPGESDVLFDETAVLLKQAVLNYLHVFPYSRRPGTPAADMAGQVPDAVKKGRADRLRRLGGEFKERSAAAMKGKCVRVLAERGGKGHADNFYMVRLPPGVPVNTFIMVKITGCDKNNTLIGQNMQ